MTHTNKCRVFTDKCFYFTSLVINHTQLFSSHSSPGFLKRSMMKQWNCLVCSDNLIMSTLSEKRYRSCHSVWQDCAITDRCGAGL